MHQSKQCPGCWQAGAQNKQDAGLLAEQGNQLPALLLMTNVPCQPHNLSTAQCVTGLDQLKPGVEKALDQAAAGTIRVPMYTSLFISV